MERRTLIDDHDSTGYSGPVPTPGCRAATDGRRAAGSSSRCVEPEPGFELCDSHSETLALFLRDVPSYWLRLDPTPGVSETNGRRAPGFHSSPPVSLHIVSLTDPRSSSNVFGRDDVENEAAIHEQLFDLTITVAQSMGRTTDDVPRNVAVLCDILTEALPFIVRWEHAGIAYRTIESVLVQLRRAANDVTDDVLGQCIGTATDGMQCGRLLFMPNVERNDNIDPKRPIIECDCGMKYRARDLVRLYAQAAIA